MSNPGKPISDLDQQPISDRLNHSSTSCFDTNANKPDFRQLDLGSPVSPLRTARPTGAAPTTSSSSRSSGSISGRKLASKAHSGELSDTVKTRPGHARSNSGGSTGSHPVLYSGSSVNSPPLMNVLPAGNICPLGRVLKTGMASRQPSRTDVLGSGTGNYGHGSIMRSGGVGSNAKSVGGSVSGGDLVKRAMASLDPEQVKRVGNEEYKKGHFSEALSLYDRAISLCPANAAYRSNRAAALTGLGRVIEAVIECEEAVRLDSSYGRAHQRLGSLLIRLGQVEVSKKHLFHAGNEPDAKELQKLQAVEKHLTRCIDARKIEDWNGALREGDLAISAGADYCPQLFACRAESLLKLQQLDQIDTILSNIPKIDSSLQCCSHSKFFGMLSEAYLFYVRAQIEMALGRFENAVTFVEKAGKIDPRNIEVAVLLNNVRLVARARARGNDLFKSERFTEACAAYGEGLKLDPSNSVLYCNRAACWYKLGIWEKSIEDCNHALRIQPNYIKALLRRAASNSKLERWHEAVRDYEVLRREIPHDSEVAESLFHAQVALKKSCSEEVSNMKFGGDVDAVLGLEQFRAEISSRGVSVVHFEMASNPQCKRLSSFLDSLCGRYSSINFLKVNVEENHDIADAENVRTVPTFKIYKNGSRVKEIVNPTSDILEASVRHYSV